LEEVDTNLIKVLLATEDIRFYEHHGIDVRSVFAGVFSTASGDKRGASTITQQLVKKPVSYPASKKSGRGRQNTVYYEPFHSK
jgi:penicillin-binding protein 1A